MEKEELQENSFRREAFAMTVYSAEEA